MICNNCKCVVPDASSRCMYCGQMFSKKSSNTTPVGSSPTRNVTFYETFPNTQQVRDTQPTYNSSKFYENRSYSPYDGYKNHMHSRDYDYYGSAYGLDYDSYAYHNTRARDLHGYYEEYTPYHSGRYRGSYNEDYYRNRENYRGYIPYKEVAYGTGYEKRNDYFSSSFNRGLMFMLAADVIFLLIICMILLLVTL